MDYLLDGLHEDLNLVRGRKDAERALSVEAEAELERLPEVVGADREWERYRDLNDSVVIDFFQGESRWQCGWEVVADVWNAQDCFATRSNASFAIECVPFHP